MAEKVFHKASFESQRRSRLILMNLLRFLLILVFFFAYFEGRKLLLFSSFAAFVLTFASDISSLIFKKQSDALYEVILILLLFGLLSFWEITGVYINFWPLALGMNLAKTIAIGLLGLTLVYAFFKYLKLEENALAISFFSFCFAFTLGVLFELGEALFDWMFRFHITDAKMFGIMGDLGLMFLGSLVVSYAGFYSLKKGNPILISRFLENVFDKNPRFFGIKNSSLSDDSLPQVLELIKSGESNKVEFKSTLRKNLHTNTFDKQIEHAILKTLTAYLNSEGGTLLVGVSDTGDVLGLESDQFLSNDHVHSYLVRLINDHIGAEFLPLIQAHLVSVDGKSVLKVDCKKSKTEAFLKSGKEEQFYVRQGSASIPLSGRTLLNYIETTFRTKN